MNVWTTYILLSVSLSLTLIHSFPPPISLSVCVCVWRQSKSLMLTQFLASGTFSSNKTNNNNKNSKYALCVLCVCRLCYYTLGISSRINITEKNGICNSTWTINLERKLYVSIELAFWDTVYCFVGGNKIQIIRLITMNGNRMSRRSSSLIMLMMADEGIGKTMLLIHVVYRKPASHSMNCTSHQ